MKGKRVLITGAFGGLGRAISATFAESGARLALHGHRLDKERRRWAAGLPGEAVLYAADLSDPREIESLFAHIAKDFEGLDVLVNNAARQELAPVEAIGPAEWDAMMAVNSRAPHLCLRAFASLRRTEALQRGKAEPEAAVVNVASIEATASAPNHSHYDASKAGLVQYGRAAGLELGAEGIRVNTVSPGLLDLPGIDDGWPDGVRRYREAAALKRLVTPEEVARAVLFLAGEEASGISGVDLRVDAGVGTTPGY